MRVRCQKSELSCRLDLVKIISVLRPLIFILLTCSDFVELYIHFLERFIKVNELSSGLPYYIITRFTRQIRSSAARDNFIQFLIQPNHAIEIVIC